MKSIPGAPGRSLNTTGLGTIPRCAMTTHDPGTGLRDYDTLRAIKEYRGQVDGKDLMFGVWGEVERPGVIRLGDEVRVLA